MRKTAVHLPAIPPPSLRVEVHVIGKVGRVIFIGSSKSKHRQFILLLRVFAHCQKTVQPFALLSSTTLKELAFRKPNAVKFVCNFLPIERKAPLLLTVRQPRHLCAEHGFGFRPSVREKISTLARIIEIVLLRTVIYAGLHVSLNSLHRRVPDKLVNLEVHPGGDVICDHPFRKLTRIEEAMGSVASAAGVFAEGRREKNGTHSFRQIVPP